MRRNLLNPLPARYRHPGRHPILWALFIATPWYVLVLPCWWVLLATAGMCLGLYLAGRALLFTAVSVWADHHHEPAELEPQIRE